jgi:ribosome-binding factor A
MKRERLIRAQSISKKIISEYIITELQELASEFGIVTVTEVIISNDLGYMDVFVSGLKNTENLTKELSEHAHPLHRSL